jgi:hypothetical protein
MKEYTRKYPLFSLCGLNCGLCPRHYTEGKSRCPGCGGGDFHLLHPSCAVITCSRKHGVIEYCCECTDFPCERYTVANEHDSFISHRNVLKDLTAVKNKGIDNYKRELDIKVDFLTYLLQYCDDGKRKSFYCTAVNLLELEDILELSRQIKQTIGESALTVPKKAGYAAELISGRARSRGIETKLRK